jgi:glycosyltransferase involved in cell wall biosynthesis
MHEPLVSISCITFNHSLYIRTCLDGLINQRTNFDYEILIYDDASNDGTREIIEEYSLRHPNIKAICQSENQYSKGVRGIMARFNFPRARGKYIALCEGDDYWTDPYKLQKQVDFLEQNPDFSICWTRYSRLVNNEICDSEWEGTVNLNERFVVNLDNFSYPYITYTLTAMFRRECLRALDLNRLQFAKDNTLYVLCLKEKLGAVLNHNTAVYRIHEGGVYSMKPKYVNAKSSLLNLCEIICFIPEAQNQHFKFLVRHFDNQVRLFSEKTLMGRLRHVRLWLIIFRIPFKSRSWTAIKFFLNLKLSD